MSFHTIDVTSSYTQSTRKLPPVPPIDRANLRGYGKHIPIDDFVIVVLLVSDALILLVDILNDNQSTKIQLYHVTSGKGKNTTEVRTE